MDKHITVKEANIYSMVVQRLKNRGFIVGSIEKIENQFKIIFINNEPEIQILCEVNIGKRNTFEFIYTHESLFGMFKSGEFENVENEEFFSRILFMFLKTVKETKWKMIGRGGFPNWKK